MRTGSTYPWISGCEGRYFTPLTVSRSNEQIWMNTGIIEISVKYPTGFSGDESILLSRLQHVINITIPNKDFLGGEKIEQ